MTNESEQYPKLPEADLRTAPTDDPRCGTYVGLTRHRKLHEIPCGPCYVAGAEHNADLMWHRPTNPAKVEKLTPTRIRRIGIERLIAAHVEEFKALLADVKAGR
jgi:hypothetical protein